MAGRSTPLLICKSIVNGRSFPGDEAFFLNRHYSDTCDILYTTLASA